MTRRSITPSPVATAVLTAVLAAALGVALGGCNIAGPVAYFLSGPPMLEAEYVIEPRPTVVFVDDRANVITANGTALRLVIAEKVSEELMTREILLPEMVISPRDALALVRAKDRYSEPLPMDAIGRMVGAEQIIYIEMYRFAATPDGATPRPTAACQVRVLDVLSQVRLFPGDETQMPARVVEADARAVDPERLRSESSRLEVFRELSDRLGLKVARLFYKHDPSDFGQRLSGGQ